MKDYLEFLENKIVVAQEYGFEIDINALSPIYGCQTMCLP
jgi:hypothetical protein